MSKLTIYKASAGSGKTYTITQEFVNLLFRNPFDYRHLLAVTFTNKATAEMKGRIIETLYALWKHPYKNGKPAFASELVANEGDESLVRQKAALILHLILHDFSNFTVSTIDSFFQRIIRSFMQELGLHSGFKTELDSRKILEMAVDRLVMQMGQPDKRELRDWLLNASEENMESGQSWDVAKQLRSLGNEVLTENYQAFHSVFLEKLNDKQLLKAYKKELTEAAIAFEAQIKEFGQKGMALIQAHGLIWDDFTQKSRTPFKIFEKMANLSDGWEKTEAIRKFVGDADSWPSDKKSVPLKAKMNALYGSGLNDLLSEFIAFFDGHKLVWNTSKLILKNFNALGIINDIANEMDSICRDESVFLLSNSNRLLFKVIGDNDAPFVYEKSGNVYKHFMIDEFQDTSSLQWNNFKPLIDNSLAQDHFSMIVGDVKQSIYRWRNSDWKLLADQVQNDFLTHGSTVKSLDTNWRSCENVVVFNNILFNFACNVLQDFFNSRLIDLPEEVAKSWNSKIINAYSDIHQKVAGTKIGSGGYIHIQAVDLSGDDAPPYHETSVKKALDTIKQLTGSGVSYRDICILVRKTDEARLITNALMSGDYLGEIYPVVSNEALMLSNSLAVSTIVNEMYQILDPNNAVYKGHSYLYDDAIAESSIPKMIIANQIIEGIARTSELAELKGLPLLDLVEKLIQNLPSERLKQEGVFLQAFIDSVTAFIQDESADLSSFLEWWETDGQQKSVSVPEDQDAIRVMTVHKSKGLEFDHVIMPFLNWEMNQTRHTSYLWCTDPFGKLDFIPIKYEKGMLDSSFSNDYLNELLHQLVDNLNILYVAFTRAKKSLWGIVPYKSSASEKKDSEVKISSVDTLLLSVLRDNSQIFGTDAKWEDDCFTSGQLLSNQKDVEKTQPTIESHTGEFQTIDLPSLKSWSYSDRVQIFMESDSFLDEASKKQINKGKVLHRLFEMVKTGDDIPDAVQRLVIEGLIPSELYEYWIDQLRTLISQPIVCEWFTNQTKIYNETPILNGANTLRPDRVVFNGQKYTVIDYKFGETHSPSHLSQVRRYMGHIKQMGNFDIEGFVWYVLENKILPVPDKI